MPLYNFALPIAVVPRASVGFPGAQANPTKVRFTSLIFANHVVTTSIFFNDCSAFWTLFGVSGDPIGRL